MPSHGPQTVVKCVWAHISAVLTIVEIFQRDPVWSPIGQHFSRKSRTAGRGTKVFKDCRNRSIQSENLFLRRKTF